nr:glucose-6-phosphate isomerase [Desulfobacterales bacterium]
MSLEKCSNLTVWESLKEHSTIINRPENHLKNLLQAENRLEKFSSGIKGFFYDFSRQRVDQKTMEMLFELAKARELKEKFNMMASGEKINYSENRAVLHTATRSFSDAPVMVDGINVMPELIEVREKIKNFVKQVETGEIKGSTGKPFEDIVVIGIGGSYLGTEFVSTALKAYTKKNITLHYLANVDIHNFGAVAALINPEKTLWIVISKTYTTAETMANANQAEAFMRKKGLDPAKHIVTVTSKGSPGDDPKSPKLSSFHMFDFIGGRYSVTSAVGGVPLGLQLGYDMFERFLKGAELMDIHTQTAPMEENIPLIAALIAIWNNNFLGYPTQAV